MHVGIDAGGTTTRAVIVATDGTCHGYGVAGAGNPVSWGPETAAREIVAAVAAAQPADDVTGVAALAMAGGATFATESAVAAQLAAIGVHARVEIESDLVATFCAGTPRMDGYALVAGTGAAAIRVRGGAVAASSDGLGWLLGDDGSGFWIGHRALRAALAALDHRGPDTALTGLLLTDLGIADGGAIGRSGRPAAVQAAVDLVYRRRPVQLSELAATVFRAAAEGDAVALDILAGARDLLVGTVRSVCRSEVAGPVVLGGGVARRLPGLADAIITALARPGTRPPEVHTVTDGAVGAGVLALRRNGVAVDQQVFRRLQLTLAERRGEPRA